VSVIVMRDSQILRSLPLIPRRVALRGLVALAGVAAIAPGVARAQQVPPGTGPAGPVQPPTTTTSPPRDFTQPSVYFSDPDVLAIDPSFNDLTQGNTTIQRLWHGDVNGKPQLWMEGPAWSAQGKYLLWSDIPNGRQMRWLDDDGHVSVFRELAINTNGNSFDYQGRQLGCEHLTRRVVRYEHDGGITVIADSWNGKRLNSPNDVVPHPDGSIWFTDPPYGGQLYEGDVDQPGGPTNPNDKINARAGQPAGFPAAKRELPNQVYRWDPSGTLDAVIKDDQVPDPNGLAFSADMKTLYVVSTGKGPGDTGPGGQNNVYAFDVSGDGKSVSNMRLFTDCMVDDVKCGPDGIRSDIFGNMWMSSNAGRNQGYNGVTVWSPAGTLLGRIRIPEVVGNLTFGGPKRNRLFMVGSTSLYAVFLGVQGAAPG
jgi:gluconolactonase